MYRRKDLGGQKWTLVGKNAKWTVVGKNGSSRGASCTEAPLHLVVDVEVGGKMDLAQQEWTLVGKNGPWWARTVRSSRGASHTGAPLHSVDEVGDQDGR